MPFAKFLPLMRFSNMSLDDLTLADLMQIASAFGISVNITEELQQAALALLKGEDIHTVADMIQSPESLAQLMDFLDRRSEEEKIAQAEVDFMYGHAVLEEPVKIENSRDNSVSEPYPTGLVASPLVGWRLIG